MKKQVILRGLLGVPLGIAMSTVIGLMISVVLANGRYAPCAPSLVLSAGNELNAMLVQTLLSGLLGATFGASSVIWELDRWSLFKQTGTYFSITSFVMMAVAYFSYWMEHSIRGLIIYFIIFVGIFIFVWLVQYLIWKKRIKRINEKLP